MRIKTAAAVPSGAAAAVFTSLFCFSVLLLSNTLHEIYNINRYFHCKV